MILKVDINERIFIGQIRMLLIERCWY